MVGCAVGARVRGFGEGFVDMDGAADVGFFEGILELGLNEGFLEDVVIVVVAFITLHELKAKSIQ